jgi:hypothetical protein
MLLSDLLKILRDRESLSAWENSWSLGSAIGVVSPIATLTSHTLIDENKLLLLNVGCLCKT